MAGETTDRHTDVYDVASSSKHKVKIISAGLFVISLSLAWNLSHFTQLVGRDIFRSPLKIIGAGLIICLLTIIFERLLRHLITQIDVRYRLSMLGSAGIGWITMIYPVANGSLILTSIWDLLVYLLLLVWFLFVAFLGGLIITSSAEGLVENNYPPSEDIEKEVYERHLRLIGRPPKTSTGKRTFDISLSLIGMVISAPIWLFSALTIWLENPGPLLFVKNSVGRGGKNFRQYKFRTMIRGAEEETGPVMASEGDLRVLHIGKLLRKTALDELPQLINILKDEMSFVGPRPQRTVMVNDYLKSMPEYAERHLVLPGLAGLAQVAGDYYLTPRQKLRFDRVYIQHANLSFDLLLILLAFLVAFWFRWQRDWDGRLPRRLLHAKTRS